MPRKHPPLNHPPVQAPVPRIDVHPYDEDGQRGVELIQTTPTGRSVDRVRIVDVPLDQIADLIEALRQHIPIDRPGYSFEDWLSDNAVRSTDEVTGEIDEDDLWRSACLHFKQDPAQDGTPMTDRFFAWLNTHT